MTALLEAFTILVRWIHFGSASLLVGVFACLVLVARAAGRAAGPDVAFAPLDRRLLGLGAWALAAALASGLLDLWRQTAVATGLPLGESLTPSALASVLLGTQYGTVWLVRHALFLLLGGFLLLTEEERDARDWLALRLEGVGLAVVSLAILGAAGHAASAQQFPVAALVVDGVHLLATGIWLGALVPLAVLLHWTAAAPAPIGLRATAVATRRFSAVGLASVGALVVTGVYNAWEQVGGFAPLFGTPYGQWLCLKIALLAPLVAVAATNLLVLKPRLSQLATVEAGGAAPGALRRLRRNVLLEAALGAAILGVVAVLGISTPARHAEPVWPFAFRLSWAATKLLPGVQTRVAVGSQIALLGLVAGLLAAIVRRRRWRLVLAGGVAAIGLGLYVALPPLAVDAYPSTYARPTVPYAAASIVDGRALFATHCVVCHGVAGYGDGPAAASLTPRPADLTARHTADHTAGDLFWWLSHGIRGSAMPGFGDRLSREGIWDLINFLRALAAAEQARDLGPTIDPDPRFVAPDFAYTTGVGEGHNLKDYRGGRIVLLAFFTLPDSRERLLQLGQVYSALRLRDAEVLAVPLTGARDVYRALGPAPIFFPIVVDGAEEAASTYTLFRRDLTAEGGGPVPPPPRHMELLVDRQGYLRARWISAAGDGWADPARLLAEVERLAKEPPRTALPSEHVH